MRRVGYFFLALLVAFCFDNKQVFAQSNDISNLEDEQAAEKSELEKMRQELNEIKATTHEAVQAMSAIDTSPLKQGLQEFHLFCKPANCEVAPGKTISCLTYNGLLPGPPIRVREGQLVRIVVHNQLSTNTSFHLHGMILPAAVDGLPSTQSGLIRPGQTYAYQFIAKGVGTYWYHPQIMHYDQKVKGMYGIFIVEPAETVKTVDKDIILVLSDTGSWYLVNGKTAPAIPAIEVSNNSRVRMRVINAGQRPVPLHITGHKFEVVSVNGNLTGEQTARDTITLGISDRVDLEFTANNPGVWSIGSELLEQTTKNGQFPSGIACVLRYIDSCN